MVDDNDILSASRLKRSLTSRDDRDDRKKASSVYQEVWLLL